MGARQASTLATPSMPGRAQGRVSSSFTRTRKTLRPSTTSAMGWISSTAKGSFSSGWAAAAIQPVAPTPGTSLILWSSTSNSARSASSGATSNSTSPLPTGAPSCWARSPATTVPLNGARITACSICQSTQSSWATMLSRWAWAICRSTWFSSRAARAASFSKAMRSASSRDRSARSSAVSSVASTSPAATVSLGSTSTLCK